MVNLDVRILRLEPMRVASSYGFGASPEIIAHQKMTAFLEAKNMLQDYGGDYEHGLGKGRPRHIHFGFNNPNPSAESPSYGYEVWVTVELQVEPLGDVRIIDFMGGLYAVTRFENIERIGQVWQELWNWRDHSQFKPAHHQYLENLINPLETDMSEFVFDLYLPIAE